MPAAAAEARSTFSRSVILLMAAGTVILVIIIGASMWLAASTGRLGEEVVRARATRTSASMVLENLLNAETSQRGYLLTGNERYLGPYRTSLPVLSRELRSLNDGAAGNQNLIDALPVLNRLVDEKLRELADTIVLAQAGRRDDALAVVRSDRGINAMDEARTALRKIVGETETVVFGSIARMNSNAALLQWVTTLGGVMVILLGLAAMWLVFRSIQDTIRARKAVEELNQTLEDRVVRRTEALTRANDEIQRFAYIVSHDLRAPLVNIMGFTSELEVGTKALNDYFAEETPASKAPAREAATEALPEAVKFIRSSTGKMDRLINAILKLSREGRRELIPEKVDLGKVFEAIVGSLKHQIDETRTRVEISPRLPVIVSDRLALEQIFGNLVDNALKYLQPGRPGHLVIDAESSRNSLTVIVRDNGRGIAENDLERVFELFRRAGRQDRAGEGIGLAHVRALVRRLGGDITLSSQLGEGSEFRVLLPRTLPTDTGSA